MAGHSQFKNIMHRKGRQDAQRSKLFSKLAREITVAAKAGLPDPAMNPRLRLAVNEAKANSMPKENIERAIKKATGGEGENYEEVRYEGYGPGGVAVMVDCMTDNRNRTVGEVRHAFSKHGGNLGSDGSVAFMFSKNGVLSYPAGASEDRILEVALEAGAQDVVTNDDGSIDVLTTAEDFGAVKDALEAAGLKPEAAEVTMRASTSTRIDGENAERMMKLLDVLEDLDDVQKVYSNADISDEVLAKLA